MPIKTKKEMAELLRQETDAFDAFKKNMDIVVTEHDDGSVGVLGAISEQCEQSILYIVNSLKRQEESLDEYDLMSKSKRLFPHYQSLFTRKHEFLIKQIALMQTSDYIAGMMVAAPQKPSLAESVVSAMPTLISVKSDKTTKKKKRSPQVEIDAHKKALKLIAIRSQIDSMRTQFVKILDENKSLVKDIEADDDSLLNGTIVAIKSLLEPYHESKANVKLHAAKLKSLTPEEAKKDLDSLRIQVQEFKKQLRMKRLENLVSRAKKAFGEKLLKPTSVAVSIFEPLNEKDLRTFSFDLSKARDDLRVIEKAFKDILLLNETMRPSLVGMLDNTKKKMTAIEDKITKAHEALDKFNVEINNLDDLRRISDELHKISQEKTKPLKEEIESFAKDSKAWRDTKKNRIVRVKDGEIFEDIPLNPEPVSAALFSGGMKRFLSGITGFSKRVADSFRRDERKTATNQSPIFSSQSPTSKKSKVKSRNVAKDFSERLRTLREGFSEASIGLRAKLDNQVERATTKQPERQPVRSVSMSPDNLPRNDWQAFEDAFTPKNTARLDSEVPQSAHAQDLAVPQVENFSSVVDNEQKTWADIQGEANLQGLSSIQKQSVYEMVASASAVCELLKISKLSPEDKLNILGKLESQRGTLVKEIVGWQASAIKQKQSSENAPLEQSDPVSSTLKRSLEELAGVSARDTAIPHDKSQDEFGTELTEMKQPPISQPTVVDSTSDSADEATMLIFHRTIAQNVGQTDVDPKQSVVSPDAKLAETDDWEKPDFSKPIALFAKTAPEAFNDVLKSTKKSVAKVSKKTKVSGSVKTHEEKIHEGIEAVVEDKTRDAFFLKKKDGDTTLVTVSRVKKSKQHPEVTEALSASAAVQDPEDQACELMLRVMWLSKRKDPDKSFSIDNCEDNPALALRFYMGGIVRGLDPHLPKKTEEAIKADPGLLEIYSTLNNQVKPYKYAVLALKKAKSMKKVPRLTQVARDKDKGARVDAIAEKNKIKTLFNDQKQALDDWKKKKHDHLSRP